MLKQRRAFLLAVLVAISTIMTLAAAVSGWVQVRRAQAVQANKLEWKDAVAHTAFSFERQFLQFRGRLSAVIVSEGRAEQQEDLALRWEVFVSRIRLFPSTQGMDKLAEGQAYQVLMPRLDKLVAQGDRLLASRPLSLPEAKAMLESMDSIAYDVQAMSRAAASVTVDLVEQQFDALQQQAILIGALAALQVLLLLVVGFALRTWQRQQIDARLRLEQLAGELSEAKLAAETAARTKSQFLANMSHELRTPFQGVLGMLQLLEKTPLSRAQQELVLTARGSATHLLSILNEILDLSAIEAGKAILHPAPLDLHRLCKEVEAPMRVQAEERGLSLVVHFESEMPTWVLGDATRIKQILFNLLNNAIKFTPKGEVRLDVRGVRQADGSFHLSLRVVDTGIGMDAETQARLFQRFAPGDGSLTRRFGGAGLGLEISRNLARLMGGDLEATSELGKGSRFVLNLQLPPATAQEAEPLPASPVRAAPRGLRVLVVDDHPINRRYMGLVLESLGHHAMFCGNGQEALESVQAQAHDAILMDIHMPVMDGLEATRAIRALGGRFAAVPILALSADVVAGSRERAFSAGCNAFLSKPIQIESLVSALGLVEGEGPREAEAAPPEVAPPPQEAVPCLSPRFGEMAARLPKARLRELLAMFFADESRALAGLREALLEGDGPVVGAAAHKCKGSARLLGLQSVADVAEEAEDWARGGESAREPEALVTAFDAALADSRRALARWMEEPDGQPA